MATTETATEYRLIEGFPGYRVGSDGSVWSSRRGRPWRRLRPGRNRFGHPRVVLMPGRHSRSVHRLVLEAFVGQCPAGMECRHYPDRNPANNRLGNLQWATPRRNMADKLEHGTASLGERNGRAILTEQQVKEIRTQYTSGLIGLKPLGRRYGVHFITIRDIVKRKSWKHLV